MAGAKALPARSGDSFAMLGVLESELLEWLKKSASIRAASSSETSWHSQTAVVAHVMM